MNTQSTSQYRLQTHRLAQELLDKRNQLWNLREELVRRQPYRLEQPIEPLVRRFCEELIDYISLEHFGIFHHLLNGEETESAVLDLAEEIYPRLLETTGAALDFNDRCESYSTEDLCRELPGALAMLSDELAARGELEDRLIDGILA